MLDEKCIKIKLKKKKTFLKSKNGDGWLPKE
jgi:hypothetical protein